MPLDPKYYMDLHGKPFVLFPGLLAAAHEAGLETTETIIEQIPSEANKHTAVVRSTVTFRDENGRLTSYTCVGDASPATTKLNAYLRMAETRALARCFRLALNVGETALEELADDDEAAAPRGYPREQAAPRGGRSNGGGAYCSWEGCGVELTPGQAQLSRGKYNAELCPTHQKEADKAAATASR